MHDNTNPDSEVNRYTGPTQQQHVDEIVPLSRLPVQSSPPTSPAPTDTHSKSPDTRRASQSYGPYRRRIVQHGAEDSGEPILSGKDNADLETGEKEDRKRKGKEDEQVEQSGVDEYWLSSTGFPLIAATWGPVANLLSVCALVESWRVLETDHLQQEHDPHWAYAINGLSLFLGLAANISLLLTFFHLAPNRFLQPFTVLSWLLSAFLLISLIIVYIHTPTLNPRIINISSPEPQRKLTWSQSYYYAILSSTIYFLITLLLSQNLYSAYILKRFPPGLRGLTNPQRTLMVQSTGYMIYLSLGALAFAHIENWRFLDAIYWADYTLLTVGIGSDFAPITTTGRVFVGLYAWGGIVMVGLVISGVRGLVLEKGKGRMKVGTVRRGKKVVKWLIERKWKGRMRGGKEGVQGVMEQCENGSSDGVKHPVEKEFEEKGERVHREATWWTEWLGLSYAICAFFLLWLGGAAVFWFLESEQRWTYGDALYFTNIALLTIGYGDFYPKSEGGKPFFVLWSLLAVPTVTVLISSVQDTIISGIKRAAKKRRRRKLRAEGMNLGGGPDEEKGVKIVL